MPSRWRSRPIHRSPKRFADLEAILLGDPFWGRAIEPLLYSKGLHALQAYRLAHWLWSVNRRDLALFIQSPASEVFQTDIHPTARVGRGIFLDRATGLVIGATAVVEDYVSLQQGVTLGGTDTKENDRHRKVRRSAVIAAGAKVLGGIEIGAFSRIVAGSAVLQPVPARATVAGAPAKIVGEATACAAAIGGKEFELACPSALSCP
jgi:serine O-acetyltransferase